MKKPTLLESIKSWLADIGWKLFIWGNDFTQEEYWERIFRQELAFNHGEGRRSGQTTRLADFYIQRFFKFGECTVSDHYGTRAANKLLFNIVFNRLTHEHNLKSPHLVIYRDKFTLKHVK